MASRTNGIGLRLKYIARPLLSNTTLTHAGLASCSGDEHRRSERGHAGRRILLQQLDNPVDVLRRHLRLVALHVHHDLSPRQLAGDFRHPVGTARAVGARHDEVAAEALHLGGNLSMIGRHEHAGRTLGGAGRLIGVLQECLSGLAQKHLPRQPRGAVTSRDDDVAAWRGRRRKMAGHRLEILCSVARRLRGRICRQNQTGQEIRSHIF